MMPVVKLIRVTKIKPTVEPSIIFVHPNIIKAPTRISKILMTNPSLKGKRKFERIYIKIK